MNTVNLDILLFSPTVFCLLGKCVILNTANDFFFHESNSLFFSDSMIQSQLLLIP